MGTLSCGSQVRRTRYLLRKGLLVGGPGLISVLALLAPDLGFLGRLGLPCRTGAIPASTSEQFSQYPSASPSRCDRSLATSPPGPTARNEVFSTDWWLCAFQSQMRAGQQPGGRVAA